MWLPLVYIYLYSAPMSSITTYLTDGLDGGHVLPVVEDSHVPVHGLVAGVPVVNGGPHLGYLCYLDIDIYLLI